MSTHRRRVLRSVTGVNAEVFHDFVVGQRVMTVDGIPGTVTDIQDGPVPQTEAYEVVLDNDMGGGTYSVRDLSPLDGVTAAVIGQVVPVVIPQPVDDPSLHLASEDYPELGDILIERPPLLHNEPLRMNAVKEAAIPLVCADCGETYFTDGEPHGCTKTAAFIDTPGSMALFEAAGDLLGKGNDSMAWVDVPGETRCPVCMGTGYEPEGPCITCAGVGILYDGPNVVAAPTAEQVTGAHDQVLFATSALWDRVLDSATNYLDDRIPGMETGQVWSYDYCRFRRNRTCFYPKEMDLAATQQSGFATWVPYDRGLCWRDKWVDQQACPVGEPGPKSGDPRAMVDATVAWSEGGQRAASLTDTEYMFEFTAAWTDVRDKAKRIRSGGGVKVVSILGDRNSGRTVTGEVKGDSNVYEASIQSEPGRSNVALWTCACPWAAYSWGRSGRWKKYEGRMCAHALALTYEAQSKNLMEVVDSPNWGEDVTVMRPGDYTPPSKPLEAPARAAMRQVSLDPDLMVAPAVLIAHQMLASGDPERLIIQAFGAKGSAIVAQAKVLDFSGRLQALVRGTIRTIKRIFTDDGMVELTDGQIVPVRDITYPTFHPSLGLTASLWDNDEDDFPKAAELKDEPEAALPDTTGEEDDKGDDDPGQDAAQPEDADEDEGEPSVAQDDEADRPDRKALSPVQGSVAPGLEYLAVPGDPKAAGAKDAADIAAMASRFLKEGMKAFSPMEQAEIIDEGEDVMAANLASLDLAGTHYLALEDALASGEDDDSWMF